MHIALVQPSIEDFYSTPHRVSALGLTAVDILAKQFNHTTSLFFFINSAKKNIALPKSLNYLKDYILPFEKGEAKFFTHYYQFGLASLQIAEKILASKCDVVMLSCFAYAYADSTIDLCVILKSLNSKIKIVLGGAGVSVNPSYFIDYANTILVGEAEDTLPIYFNNPSLTGIVKADNGGWQTPLALINQTFNNVYSLSFLRGCKYQCKFCSQSLTHGNQFRVANHEQIFKLFDAIKISDDPIHFNFEDDNLLQQKELWFRIMHYLKKRYKNVSFSAENGINYTHLNDDIISDLVALNFTKFNLSLAVMPKQSQNQHRFVELDHLEKTLQMIKKFNKEVIVYFIAGLNHTTPIDTIDTLLYLFNQPCTLGISPFYAVPNLKDYEIEKLPSLNPIFYRSSSFYPWSTSHSTIDLITAFRLSRIANFIKNGTNNYLKTALLSQKKLLTLNGKELYQISNLNNQMVADFFSKI